MFTSSPQFSKLTQQVARAIEDGIRQGTWRGFLPGERILASSLQVSRRTVRGSLQILRRSKVIGPSRNDGSAILRNPSRGKPSGPLSNIGLLMPESLDQGRPHTTMFIDALRTLLYAHGYRLDAHIGPSYFTGRPGTSLEKLVARFPHDGWILTSSNQANQSWFQQRGIPTVVAGTAHEGISLPFVDVDLQAASRHAANHLLRRGHTRLALLLEDSGKAGDIKTETGFLEGVRQAGPGQAAAQVLKHSGGTGSIRNLLTRLVRGATCPTALYIANPYHYLAAYSILVELGFKVPRDISLVCRDDDLFLSYLAVEPCRYVCRPDTRAKAIFASLMSTMRGEAGQRELLFPDFAEGRSVRQLNP